MQKLKTNKSPFAESPPTNEPVQWVKPELVCEVKFAEWTAAGLMRQPIFEGMRDDKLPSECRFERPHDAVAEKAEAAKTAQAERAGQNHCRALHSAAETESDCFGACYVGS